MDTLTKSPQEAADKGTAIYKAKYQTAYEAEHPGKYVAIDITTEKAWVADTPEEALTNAQKANPAGFFHLIRIGSAGVFRVGYTQHNAREWFT